MSNMNKSQNRHFHIKNAQRGNNPATAEGTERDIAAVYEALYAMSQGFKQILAAMDRINGAGLAAYDLFEGCRSLVKEAAAWARHQVIEALRERELTNWSSSEREFLQWQQESERDADVPSSSLSTTRKLDQLPRKTKLTGTSPRT